MGGQPGLLRRENFSKTENKKPQRRASHLAESNGSRLPWACHATLLRRSHGPLPQPEAADGVLSILPAAPDQQKPPQTPKNRNQNQAIPKQQ